MEEIKYLVFSGGGIRGVAYAKIPLILEKYGILSNIEGVAGTSAGSIIAGLLAIKMTPDKIYDIITNMDYNKFKDDSYGILFDLYRFTNKYGWNRGDYFHNWYEKILEEETGIREITLEDAYNLTKIELTVVSTCWNTSNPEYINYKTYPKLPVSAAVRMSMSYPLFFVPYSYNGMLYVDGGMTNNFPIELYPKENVLGFKLLSNSQKIQDGRLVTNLDPKNIIVYTTNLISIMLTTVENNNMRNEYLEKTVFIDTGDISSMDFDIALDEELWLIKNGEEALRKYLEEDE